VRTARFSTAGIRAILAAAVVGAIIWGCIFWAVGAFAAGPIPAHGGRTPCPNLQACRAAVKWQAKDRRHLKHELAVQTHPDVVAAVRLASDISGVSFARLWTISGCESTHDPFNVTGQYEGLFQLGAWHRSFPDLRGLSPFNPYANAMHAALFIARNGEGQWSCKSNGRVAY
jgi:hypothetical protein